ncbi:protein AMN1 homolog [Acanthaster planci]|uniref:Protein AMN1 homolog n=1 Tax=Acanthaster planci TaxID=133434 RepID=A0A8B7YND1_ACAPL|nr:protein AMN1 homolog [Acanthaster planci]
MADDLNNFAISSLLTLSVDKLLSVLPHHLSDVERLPPHIKNKLLHLMSKRGLVTDDVIDKVIHNGTKILDLGECDITDEGLNKLTVCKNLRKLDLNSAKESRTRVTSAGLQVVAQSCPLLQVLYLRRCLNVTDAGLIALAQNCRQLMEINIGGCRQITDSSLIAVGQNCRMLRSFNFSKSQVSDEGVIALAMGVCKQSLMEVHMDHCIHLTDDAVEAVVQFCPRISILLFHGCPCITDRSRQALEEIQGQQSHIKQVTWTIY